MLQVDLLELILAQLGPKLVPTWLNLGPCLAQVGSNLDQLGPMFDPFPGPHAPLGQPKPFQKTSLWPHASQTPTRPKMEPKRASQTSNLDSKPATWTPKHPKMESKRLPARTSNPPCPGSAEWGVVSLNIKLSQRDPN